MKKTFFLVGILLLSVSSLYAQNGGQSDSNSVAKFEYLGYSNGNYIVVITNYTDCCLDGVVRINSCQNQKFKVNNVDAHEVDTLYFVAPAHASKITFKPKNNSCLSGNVGLLEIDLCEAMSVKWGDQISVQESDNQMLITWTTESETSNDHFDIEGSADGISFHKLTQIKSQAVNGNSATPINYSVSLNLANKMSLGFFFLGFLGFTVLDLKKKRLGRLILALIFFGIGSLIFSACQKDKDLYIKQTNHTRFVRIAQIDKDGVTSYSKVIHVLK